LISLPKKKFFSLLLTPLLLIPIVSSASGNAYSEAQLKGSYINQIRFIQYLDENVALQQVKAGNLDTYFYRIPLEVVSDIKTSPNLKIYERTAGSIGLLLNPAPAKDPNSINPFQFRQVRYALNYLINRDFVVDEILKGYGTSMIDPFGIYSPEYLNVIDTVESFNFRYNPQFAEKVISDTLIHAGASKVVGKWMFNGSPITVKILIRSDDTQRQSVGELISSELEKIGITVKKDFGDLNKANSIVYGSDPQDFQWQIYTEAYAGTSAFVKYNPVMISQMYAPYFGNMPGGQNPSFWHYQNATLDDLAQKIQFSNFTSEEARNDLVRNATKYGIQESVRIFVASNTVPYVASSTLKGLVNDFGAGITSKLSLINAQPTKKGSMDIGVKQIYQGAWNNVAGCKDAYCTDIYGAVSDGATFRNPYTGDVIPMREQWIDISTAGPSGRIKVPTDTRTWDPSTQQWKNASDDTTAKSKVTYKILFSKWHNGIPMDKSDLIYSQYFFFQWGANKSQGNPTFDPEFTSQAEIAVPLVKGFKFISSDEIQSYVDFWHYDKKEIADFASVWASEPWDITAATERLVTAGKFAYSKGQATVKNVDWLSLLIADHANMIKTELQKMKDENFVPNALKGIVSVDGAKKRYDASISWISAHQNAVVGNGPFYLDSYNPSGGIIILKAFRDPSYPFEQGHWSVYEHPKLANIDKVQAPRFVKLGQPINIQINVKVDGQPSNNVSINYFMSNKEGRIISHGIAKSTPATVGIFQVNLLANETSKISVGPNLLKLFANGKDAFRPDISTNTILGIP
jgi:peptide/nickel transport system substrate-binding protein